MNKGNRPFYLFYEIQHCLVFVFFVLFFSNTLDNALSKIKKYKSHFVEENVGWVCLYSPPSRSI